MTLRVPLRWVGGKQRLAQGIAHRLAEQGLQNGRYLEPFLGGGSVFFGVNADRALVGDSNQDLMLFYRYLRNQPHRLRREVESLDILGSREEYEERRQEFNNDAGGLRRAALFLYLNRTGFNGIWRVNRLGRYTVPYGYRRLRLSDEWSWLECSRRLRNASLVTGDYSSLLDRAHPGDTVYLDPPYLDTSGKELFARYTDAGFGRHEHQRLCDKVAQLSLGGVRVLVTVREDPWIREIYRDFKIDVVDTRNVVGARGGHRLVSDLLIRNFD